MADDSDTLSNNSNSKIIVPTDINGNPITDDRNPAYLAGAIAEAEEFYERTGYFTTFYKHGVVNLGNGKTVVDSVAAVPFVSGQIQDLD